MRSNTIKVLALSWATAWSCLSQIQAQTLRQVDVFRDAVVTTWVSEVRPGINPVARSLHATSPEQVMIFGGVKGLRGALRMEEEQWWPDGNGAEWERLEGAVQGAELELALKRAQMELVEEDLALLRANRRVAGTSEALLVEDLSDVAEWIHEETKELLFRRVELRMEVAEGEARISKLREAQRASASRDLYVWTVEMPGGAAGMLWSQVVEPGGVPWKPADLLELKSTGQAPALTWHQRAELTLDLPVSGRAVEVRVHDAFFEGLAERPDARPMPVATYEVRRDAKARAAGTNQGDRSNSPWPGTNWLVEGLELGPEWSGEVALGAVEMPTAVRHYAVPAQSDVVNMRIVVPRPGVPVAESERALLMVDGRPSGKVWLTEEGDSLRIDAGAAHDWTVERNRQAALCSRTTLGNRVKHHRAYSITVTNRSNTAGELILEEPLPVSRQAEIEVVPESLDGGELQQATGILRWTMALSPGESRTVQFSYDLSHGRDDVIPDFD